VETESIPMPERAGNSPAPPEPRGHRTAVDGRPRRARPSRSCPGR